VPELPEVETVVRSIAPLVGRRIASAEFRCLRILRGGNPDAMAARLQGRKIAGVKRYGKLIVMSLTGGGYLMVHLGMTGKLLLGGEAGKHTHAILTLDRPKGNRREMVLLYDDSRQFGSIEFSEEFPKRVARLGPEPLEVRFEDFAGAPQGAHDPYQVAAPESDVCPRRGQYLCGRGVVSSRIHPQAMASRIRPDRARRLYDAVGRRINGGHRGGRFLDLGLRGCTGRKGFFQFSHRVYQRTGEPCVICQTPIRRVIVTQRSSHYCPKCQKRWNQAAKRYVVSGVATFIAVPFCSTNDRRFRT